MTKKKPVSEHKPKRAEAARALFSAIQQPAPSLRRTPRKTPAASTA